MFWTPTWRRRTSIERPPLPIGPWVVVGDPAAELVAAIVRQLRDRGMAVEVAASPHPGLLASARSVLLVGPTHRFEGAIERWLTAASAAARSLGDVVGEPTLLAAVTVGALSVGEVATAPSDAMALGIIGTAPREYSELRTMLIDLEVGGSATDNATAVVSELFEQSDRVVARRRGTVMVPEIERTPVAAGVVPFRRGGTYLVTGGLGGVGFVIARDLARHHGSNVVVVASQGVPEGVERSEWLAQARLRRSDKSADPAPRRVGIGGHEGWCGDRRRVQSCRSCLGARRGPVSRRPDRRRDPRRRTAARPTD